MKYTLKKDGRYYSANGSQRGFMAHGIGACYSYSLEEVRILQARVGGEIVGVKPLGGFKFAEVPIPA